MYTHVHTLGFRLHRAYLGAQNTLMCPPAPHILVNRIPQWALPSHLSHSGLWVRWLETHPYPGGSVIRTVNKQMLKDWQQYRMLEMLEDPPPTHTHSQVYLTFCFVLK